MAVSREQQEFPDTIGPVPNEASMFRAPVRTTASQGLFALLELIFHASVRQIRKTNHNAVLGLVMAIAQSVIMVLVLYAIFTILKMKGSAVRGDFMLYSMSGVFMYMTHVRTVSAVAKSDGPTSSMMHHAPMNTIVAIASAAISTLYLQVLSVLVILFFYHVVFNPITIDQPVGALAMLLLAWASGIGVGTLIKSATPWAPEVFKIVTMIYTRANVIASGKMFLANAIPTSKLAWFWWNPLFHIIDQSRGFVFLNYNPHYSNYLYPIQVSAVLLLLGLMLEFYTRTHASISWGAGK
jgi:ABC-type polysaccharide/polyol phosphate export permease